MTPARSRGNDYRDYTAGDIRTLKLIRMLRMLDMPLSTSRRSCNGEQPLSEALQAQQEVLEQQVAQLAAAMQFCAELTQQAPQVDHAGCGRLPDTDAGSAGAGHFSPAGSGITVRWQQMQHQKRFFIVSEQSINTPQEFAAVLLRYAEEKGTQLHPHKRGNVPGV